MTSTKNTVELPTTLVQFPDAMLKVTAEHVDDVWTITPSISRDAQTFTGTFVLTHRPSGRWVRLPACVACCRAAAARLAGIDVDWEGSLRPATVGDKVARQIRAAVACLTACDGGMGDCAELHDDCDRA